MKRTLFPKLIFLIFVLPALACGLLGEDPTPTPTPEPAVQVEPTPPPTETSPPPTPTEEPSPTPDVSADFVSFDSEELGLSVQYPADWVVQDFFALILATDEELLNAPDALQEGAIVAFLPDTTESLGSADPVELMNDAVTEFAMGEEAAIVGNPTATTIQGQDAAVGRLEGTPEETGVALVGQVVVIVSGDRAVVGLGLTPQESEAEYLPVIEAIMNTVVVSEPAEPEIEPEATLEPPATEGAVMLSVGDMFDSDFEENSARDFIFSGQAGNTVTIDVEPIDDGLDLVIEIFDAELNSLLRVDEVFSGGEQAIFSPPADGDYFVRVTDFAGAAGSFSISVTEGGSEPTGELIPLETGQFVEGSLAGEPVQYTFTGTAEQPSIILLQPEEDSDLTLTILGTDGAVLVDEVDDGFSGEIEAISFTPVADGEYIVLVDGFGAAEGGYNIILADLENAFTAEGVVPENGVQNYRVCVPANAVLIVFVAPAEGFDAVVDINGPGGGQLIDQTDNGFPGEPEAVILSDVVDPDVEYPIIVSVGGFGSQGGEFSITITSTSPEGVVIDGC